MKRRHIETDPEVRVVVTAGMKLRYIEIDLEVVAELPDWSEADIERESELTLKDLGIIREPHESYLHAWARAMLKENGSEDNARSIAQPVNERNQASERRQTQSTADCSARVLA